jgi:hypothetical protein
MIVIARPFTAYFEQHYFPARCLRKSPGHVTQMLLSMRRLDECFGGRITPQTCTDEDVDRFKAWRSTPGGPWYCAAQTLNKDLRNFRAIENHCFKRRQRATQLWFDFEDEFLDEPEAWYEHEVEAILASCGQERGMFGRLPRSLFWQSLGMALVSTGARISATMKTPLSAFDPHQGQLLLAARTQKHRRGQRANLHPKTVELLRLSIACEPTRRMLFPWPYDRNSASWPTLNSHWRRILARAELPNDRKHLFHCLRRTVGTRVRQHGTLEDVRDALVHSDKSVSARYIDTRQVRSPGPADRTPEPRVQPAPQRWLFE